MKNATVNGEHLLRSCPGAFANTIAARSATLMFALRPSFVYAMSVTLGPMVADVSSAVLQVLFTYYIPQTVPEQSNLSRYLGRVLLCRVHQTREGS